MPRMLSGKIWHSVACSRLSARLTAVQPTNLPAPRSATVPLLLTMMFSFGGIVSVISPCWEWTTKVLPLALVTVPPKRTMPAKGLAAGADAAGAWARTGATWAAVSSNAKTASVGLRDMDVLLGDYTQTDADGISLQCTAKAALTPHHIRSSGTTKSLYTSSTASGAVAG